MNFMDKIIQSNGMGELSVSFRLGGQDSSEYHAKRPLSTGDQDGNKENPP